MNHDAPIEWCRRRLLVPGNPLSLTLPYADPDRREALLALRATISEIAAIPGSVSDPEVAAIKLQWWRQALAERLPHPAVQALEQTGVFAELDAPAFDALIEGVTSTLAAPRFEQTGELWHHCLDVGGPPARLEARLVGGARAAPGDLLATVGAFGYLVRSVRDLVADARRDRWAVPLELQAEYQLSRAEAAEGHGGRRLHGLVRHLLEVAVQRGLAAREQLPPQAAWTYRHQLLTSELDRHLAVKLMRRPQRILQERAVSSGPLGGWRVWRYARRLRRNVRP